MPNEMFVMTSSQKKQKKKEAIFSHFVADAKASGEKLGSGQLICPLCYKPSALAKFTIEHILPSAVGGRKTGQILTCATCNNGHGSSLDAHLANFQNTVDFSRGETEMSASMEVEGERLMTMLQYEGKSGKVQVCPKRSNPTTISSLLGKMKSGAVPQIHMQIPFRFRKIELHSALVKIGYLAMFRRFAFSYIKGEEVGVIRHQLDDPSASLCDFSTLIRDCKITEEISNLVDPYAIFQGTLRVGSKHGLHFMAVFVKLSKKTSSLKVVLIPAPCDCKPSFFEFVRSPESNLESIVWNLVDGLDFDNRDQLFSGSPATIAVQG